MLCLLYLKLNSTEVFLRKWLQSFLQTIRPPFLCLNRPGGFSGRDVIICLLGAKCEVCADTGEGNPISIRLHKTCHSSSDPKFQDTKQPHKPETAQCGFRTTSFVSVGYFISFEPTALAIEAAKLRH